jgi:hypothetical protein
MMCWIGCELRAVFFASVIRESPACAGVFVLGLKNKESTCAKVNFKAHDQLNKTAGSTARFQIRDPLEVGRHVRLGVFPSGYEDRNANC